MPRVGTPPATRRPCVRRHHRAGPISRPAAEARAKPAIIPAPAAGELASAATSSADCSKPQGQATQARPRPALRAGPLMACQRSPSRCIKASARRRPRFAIQAGCRPCHSRNRPRPSAATCTRVHKGRKAATAWPSTARLPTLPAATAPAAA